MNKINKATPATAVARKGEPQGNFEQRKSTRGFAVSDKTFVAE